MRRILHAHQPEFPARLRFPRGPLWLEAIGPLSDRLDALSPAVAIVGTRRPPPYAWKMAHWLAATLASHGVTILSGGAFGIDAAAHEGALSVDGSTVALLPGTLDQFVPAANTPLFRTIAESGALVAFLQQRGEAPRFHGRNAAIAALADHVIVVSAPLRSGARNTAEHARQFGRPLWVVPGSPWEEAMRGNLLELSLDGQMLLTPLPILRAFGIAAPHGLLPKDVLFHRPWEKAPDDPNPMPYEPRRRPDASSAGPAVDPTAESPARRASGRDDAGSDDSEPLFRAVQGRGRAAPHVTSAPEPASPPAAERSAYRSRVPRTVELTQPSPVERRVLELLREAPRTVDALAASTGLPPGRLHGLLLTWTVEGVVREGPPGRFRLLNH